jgi:hypothetical protein
MQAIQITAEFGSQKVGDRREKTDMELLNFDMHRTHAF